MPGNRIFFLYFLGAFFLSLVFLPSVLAKSDGGISACTWIGGDIGKDLRDKFIKQGYKLPAGENGICGERTTFPTCSFGYKVPDNCLFLGETKCKEAAKTRKPCVPGILGDEKGAGSLGVTTSTADVTGTGSLGGEFQIINPLKEGTIPGILNAVAGFLYALALAVVTVMVLWGGFQILTAAGSPERIDKGKKTLLYAVIGTVVILVAGGIADLTADILGGTPEPGPYGRFR